MVAPADAPFLREEVAVFDTERGVLLGAFRPPEPTVGAAAIAGRWLWIANEEEAVAYDLATLAPVVAPRTFYLTDITAQTELE